MKYDFCPFIMVTSAASAHTKGDLVFEAGHYGFAYDTVLISTRYRLDVDDCAYLATKATPTEVLAAGAVVEYVAPGVGETTGKVQAHDQGVKFGVVVEASGASDTTVLVKPISALYL